MTDPTTEQPAPAPAQEAIAASAFPEPDVELWTMFVSTAAQENYSQIARDQAAIRGVEPKAVMQEMAGSFEELHQRQPLDGYDHLAQWARQHDPAAGAGPSGLTVLAARSVESARRDPYQAVIGDQALVEQGVAAQQAADVAAGTAAAAPSVDTSSGLLPSAGPLPIPPDVLVGPEGAEVLQGDPSPGVETPDGSQDAPSTSTGSAAPAPADTGTSGAPPAPDSPASADAPAGDSPAPAPDAPPTPTTGKSGKGSGSGSA